MQTTDHAETYSSQSTTSTDQQTHNPVLFGRWIGVTCLILVIKLVAMVVAVLAPSLTAGVIPPTRIDASFWLNTAFIASTAVFLVMRRWLGVLSLAVYTVLSTLGGIGLILGGHYAFWGVFVLVTTFAAALTTALAITTKEIHGKHW